MPTRQALFSVLILIGSLQPLGATDRTHYVDSTTGNDEKSGLSPEEAWKSFERASGTTYESGDRLFLKRGSVFISPARSR